jgi:hypothetical protein
MEAPGFDEPRSIQHHFEHGVDVFNLHRSAIQSDELAGEAVEHGIARRDRDCIHRSMTSNAVGMGLKNLDPVIRSTRRCGLCAEALHTHRIYLLAPSLGYVGIGERIPGAK